MWQVLQRTAVGNIIGTRAAPASFCSSGWLGGALQRSFLYSPLRKSIENPILLVRRIIRYLNRSAARLGSIFLDDEEQPISKLELFPLVPQRFTGCSLIALHSRARHPGFELAHRFVLRNAVQSRVNRLMLVVDTGQRLAVTHGQGAFAYQAAHFGRQREEAQMVRNGGLGHAYPFAYLFLGEREVLQQSLQRACFLDWIQ